MSKTLLLCLVAIGLLFSTASLALAQNAGPQQSQPVFSPANPHAPSATPEQNSKVVTLSGCLGRGAGADEYALYGQTANSWELRSQSVDLHAFLREAVTVSAVPQSDGTLNVIALSVVSEACTQY